MYLPDHFAQSDPTEIASFISAYPFATVITMVDGQLWPTQIPLFLHSDRKLIGHVARNNMMWKQDPAVEVLAIFTGPDAYVTPDWYATKHLTHKVVPTWNYASVSVWGSLTLHDDARWKRMAVGKLTQFHEHTRETPWKMGDAPQDYLAQQLDQIIGIELSISRVAAKWKLNQNRTDEDRAGVIVGLDQRQDRDDAVLADMMRATLEQS